MTKPKTATCLTCDQTIEKVRITKHIGACLRKSPRHGKSMDQYSLSSAPPQGVTIHIRVQAEEPTDAHYLHLLAHPDTSLDRLDAIIRETWTKKSSEAEQESAIRRGEATHWSSEPGEATALTLRELWNEPGIATYTYDPSLPMRCRIDEFGVYPTNEETQPDITIIARNDAPPEPCRRCKQPATHAQCQLRKRKPGTVSSYACDDCAQLIGGKWDPITNSPRDGA